MSKDVLVLPVTEGSATAVPITEVSSHEPPTFTELSTQGEGKEGKTEKEAVALCDFFSGSDSVKAYLNLDVVKNHERPLREFLGFHIGMILSGWLVKLITTENPANPFTLDQFKTSFPDELIQVEAKVVDVIEIVTTGSTVPKP